MGQSDGREMRKQTRTLPIKGLTLTPELIEEFLEYLQSCGRSASTLETYRRNLDFLYTYLPEDKRMRHGTMEKWKQDMVDSGYAAQTVNVRLAAADSLLNYCGRRELKSSSRLEHGSDVQPELTRNEYLRLLATAKKLEKEQTYLLVKVFGSIGITPQQLPELTVERVRQGRIAVDGASRRIPNCLCGELLDYAAREGISSGQLFQAKNGRPLHRSVVWNSIHSLCRDARVDEEKATPRCLRKLYQTTQAGIRASLAVLLDQSFERLIDTEQLAIGWQEADAL